MEPARIATRGLRRGFAFGLRAGAATLLAIAANAATPLYEQSPIDVAVLDAANDSAELELLPLAPGVPPTPLPESGFLTARLAENPATEIEIPYASIERFERFSDRLLREANRLVKDSDFTDAYFHFARLERDYPNTPGLQKAFNSALQAEALDRFKQGEHDHALALLQTLNFRAPGLPGLDRAVTSIGDAILRDRWEQEDYAAVRKVIDAIDRQFTGMKLPLGERWGQRISARAESERVRAQRLATAGRARDALRVAQGAAQLAPGSAALRTLIEELIALEPTLRVGVWSLAPEDAPPRLDLVGATRQGRLVGGRLAALEVYAPTGGEYASVAGTIDVAGDRRSVTIRPAPGAQRDAYAFARALLAPESERDPLSVLRRRLAAVTFDRGALNLELIAPHAQPITLLTVSLPPSARGFAAGDWRRDSTDPAAVVYGRMGGDGALDAVEETRLSTADQAMEALRTGELHVIDRVPPTKLRFAEAIPGVTLAKYRIPTVHCLLFGPDSALGKRREVRRALCYGIAREATLRTLVALDDPRPGFETLSAPFPRGLSLTDPLRYAYNDSVDPRPYEPRLAALLVAAARAADADPEGEAPTAPVPESIRLLHAPSDFARSACVAIRKQLQAIGFSIEIIEATEAEILAGSVPHDLRYAELTISEPLVDAWRLLGPGGLAGDCSPAVFAGLQRVADATTGNQAADALRDLHRILHADLPLIPLWQTAEHAAFSSRVTGTPTETIALYHTIDDWRFSTTGAP